mmetsp:Transcript_54814/g.133130  ORF Transcript_54814/g.133130 Transcript_54814/m.133130 type:complete len:87 (-) Transcript_54814:3519-3779(-)
MQVIDAPPTTPSVPLPLAPASKEPQDDREEPLDDTIDSDRREGSDTTFDPLDDDDANEPTPSTTTVTRTGCTVQASVVDSVDRTRS